MKIHEITHDIPQGKAHLRKASENRRLGQRSSRSNSSRSRLFHLSRTHPTIRTSRPPHLHPRIPHRMPRPLVRQKYPLPPLPTTTMEYPHQPHHLREEKNGSRKRHPRTRVHPRQLRPHSHKPRHHPASASASASPQNASQQPPTSTPTPQRPPTSHPKAHKLWWIFYPSPSSPHHPYNHPPKYFPKHSRKYPRKYPHPHSTHQLFRKRRVQHALDDAHRRHQRRHQRRHHRPHRLLTTY